jgi:hypothetical protein
MANESALLEDPATEEAPPSLRETLESAIDEHDPNLDGSAAPADAPAAKSGESAAAPKISTEQQVPVPAAPSTPSQDGKQPPVAAASTELKAPAQWKPAAKEMWNRIPRPVQEEVLRREGDSMRLIGSVGPKIRMADEVQTHLAPFAERLAANGVNTSQFVGDVFESVKVLAHGNPEQKASVVANIVQAYGIDLKTLDSILSQRINQPPIVSEAQREIARARNVVQQHTEFQSQQTAQAADTALAVFGADPKHEFIDDVRLLMADLIETGRAKTLEDAYSAAIWANEDTRKILLQREAEARASVKNRRAAAARTASSSVHGAPRFTGAPAINGAAGPQTLRETLEDAFDSHSP